MNSVSMSSSTPFSNVPHNRSEPSGGLPLANHVQRPVQAPTQKRLTWTRAGVGAGVGIAASTVPFMVAASPGAMGKLAPIASQFLTSAGALGAVAFGGVQQRRSAGVAPDVVLWRAMALSTAAATPLVGACTPHLHDNKTFESSLFYSSWPQCAVIAGAVKWLQTVRDLPVGDAVSVQGKRVALANAIFFVASFAVIHAATVVGFGYLEIRDDIDALPDGVAVIAAGAVMYAAGFSVGHCATQRGHGSVAAAGYTTAVIGLPLVLAGAVKWVQAYQS